MKFINAYGISLICDKTVKLYLVGKIVTSVATPKLYYSRYY